MAGDGAGTSVDFFADAVIETGDFFAAAAVFDAAASAGAFVGVVGFVVFLFALVADVFVVLVVPAFAVVFVDGGTSGDSVCTFDIEIAPVSP